MACALEIIALVVLTAVFRQRLTNLRRSIIPSTGLSGDYWVICETCGKFQC